MTEEAEEQDHWFNVMRTFLHYEEFASFDLGRRQEHINRMCGPYADRLPDISFAKFQALSHAASGNQAFFDDMVDFQSSGADKLPTKAGPVISIGQQHRNIAVLHSLYREWSAEGELERRGTFELMVDELKRRLPVTAENAYQQKVLVPGCGLGRLPLEIAASGYACQGNEYSAFMAIASNFVLNGLEQAGEYRVHPWIGSSCNLPTVQDALQGVDVPDVAAGDLLNSFQPPTPSSVAQDADIDAFPTALVSAPALYEPSVSGRGRRGKRKGPGEVTKRDPAAFPRFSMAAGDFVEVYTNLKDPAFQQEQGRACVDQGTGIVFSDCSLAVDGGAGQWDAVVTCFFLDTAPVVLEYIETIERILKPGGVWINLGPLLYHWATPADAAAEDRSDPRYLQSVELSYEELRVVVEGFGFEVLHEQWQDCTYSRCASSMMWTAYRTVMFTARKPVVVCKECPR